MIDAEGAECDLRRKLEVLAVALALACERIARGPRGRRDPETAEGWAGRYLEWAEEAVGREAG